MALTRRELIFRGLAGGAAMAAGPKLLAYTPPPKVISNRGGESFLQWVSIDLESSCEATMTIQIPGPLMTNDVLRTGRSTLTLTYINEWVTVGSVPIPYGRGRVNFVCPVPIAFGNKFRVMFTGKAGPVETKIYEVFQVSSEVPHTHEPGMVRMGSGDIQPLYSPYGGIRVESCMAKFSRDSIH